ncbi:DUF1778 domain-containing protein [Polaromonas sp. CG_9.11]|uniref:plasmid mobilization protein n=1 Tax=Polaromonas sp. CG_9.11 TaxID=2787730 RepID=UPI0018C9ABEB|nr:DUF1778 domain-containing protein [Polaromonas sp. CG_9.11]MBG6078231.1 hypothetical protein [Polaromonas sp. CG_9.11]
MTTLFKKKDDADARSVRRELRLTREEDHHIRDAAALRQLDVSEFIRRAALGRKAEVRFEIDLILMLIEVVKDIRALHSAVVATGALPPEEQWQPVISQAVAAMLRIEK